MQIMGVVVHKLSILSPNAPHVDETSVICQLVDVLAEACQVRYSFSTSQFIYVSTAEFSSSLEIRTYIFPFIKRAVTFP
jgi:hypothetical protein